MRNYNQELYKRVEFIRKVVNHAGAQGIVYGNSGGKDSALVGILCKKACDSVLGVMMPCQSKRNFESDMEDALLVARQFNIETISVDLSAVKATLLTEITASAGEISAPANANIAPRLRMTTLYAIAQSRNSLVAGTGNRSESYMGYFTKWGDGAYDFNPIADLTVAEIYEFLNYLQAPKSILQKAPSAGLFDGQTDESEMGIRYATIDQYLLYGKGTEADIEKMTRAYQRSTHKRRMPEVYQG